MASSVSWLMARRQQSPASTIESIIYVYFPNGCKNFPNVKRVHERVARRVKVMEWGFYGERARTHSAHSTRYCLNGFASLFPFFFCFGCCFPSILLAARSTRCVCLHLSLHFISVANRVSAVGASNNFAVEPNAERLLFKVMSIWCYASATATATQSCDLFVRA